MDFASIAILFAAGFGAGAVNAMAGGGTMISFPALLYVGGDAKVAAVTSIVALLPGSFGGALGYRQRFASVAGWLKIFLPVCLVGGILGSWLLYVTPTKTFDRIIPFLLLFATLLFLSQSAMNRALRDRAVRAEERSPAWLVGAALFQFAVATYGGYFSAGMGIMMLASFGILGFRDINQMNTLKVVLNFSGNLIAVLFFATTGLVHWTHALCAGLGAVVGGFAGSSLALRLPQAAVRATVTVVGLVLSALLFYKQFAG
ncbi:MAG: sulfite exporter TauE/SafE family protein [Verrucomicrobia bacterium]|nr:sulfite exporter TauE/SafE family protein [Verrucomicrobiota bacterium]